MLDWDKLTAIADKYGLNHQKNKLVEECLEYALASVRWDKDNQIEELADIIILALQVIYLLPDEELIELFSIIDYKIDRQTRRIVEAEL